MIRVLINACELSKGFSIWTDIYTRTEIYYTITELLLNCPLTYETMCVINENANELLIRNNHRLQ